MHRTDSDPRSSYLVALSLGALGVVYGDIGTSPLYALRDAFLKEHGVLPPQATCWECCR